MVRVKICGVTNLVDAMAAVEAGADALGFIFVEGTPRLVSPSEVRSIVRALPPFVTPVGVFWDHPSGHVKAVAEACGLRALQFHGEESPEDLAGYDLPVIKTVKLPPASTIEGPQDRIRLSTRIRQYSAVTAAVLLDTAARWSEGEARSPIEWTAAGTVGGGSDRSVRLILSGGLTPDNVGRAVEIVQPYAVDVNSGVESVPGRKDHDKVRRFVAAAKAAG